MNTELRIEKLVFGGNGLGFVNGKACFVEGALPGEKVVARIRHDKPNYCKAVLVKILEPSPHRIAPPCPYIGACGGCQYQHLLYTEELRWKENQVRESFSQVFREICPPIRPIRHGSREYGYRASITLHRTQKKGHKPQRLGFIARDNRSLISIDQCLLADKHLKGIFTSEYCLRKNEEKRTFKAAEDGRIVSSEEEKLYRVRVGPLSFWVNSFGFFQNNLEITEMIGRQLATWVQESNAGRLLDLYSGVGTFSLLAVHSLTEKAAGTPNVHCFEENPYSMACVEKNFKAAGIRLAGIHPGKVETRFPYFIHQFREEKTFLFLDPPRQGIASSLANFLAEEEGIETIAFLACDLPILIRDLKIILSQNRYTIREVIPFDMFPRTKHIEVLVHLHQNPS